MNTRIWRAYAVSFKGLETGVVFGALLSVLTGLTLVPIPLFVGYAFDRVIPAGRLGALVGVGAAILALHLLNGACALWTRLAILRVTKLATARMRREAVGKLLTASRAYHNAHERAALHDVVVTESERVDIMGNALLGEVSPALVLSVGVSIVLLVLNWKLFLAMLLILPLNIIAGRRLGYSVRQSVGRFHESFKQFSQGILVVLSAIDLIRIQTAERIETSRQADHIEHLRSTSTSMSVLTASYTAVQQTLIAAAGVVVLIVGGAAVGARAMTMGSLLSYFAGLMLLRSPLNAMMAGVPRVMEGVQSLARFMALLEDDDPEPYDGQGRLAFSGAIGLRNVAFSYGTKPVLTDISLTVRPGETVALIGPNGSGKSTIVNLILGFYRPQQGVVFADDTPYAELDIRDLRRHIGVVMQDPIMLPGTIRENLLYGLPETAPEDMMAASRLAGVDAFVSRLDQGYDTNIGEDGNLLSGGQRQRVALARALIGDPKLLILDEPMNHLDEANGPAFLARLMDRPNPPAVLLISHRFDVESIAHRVYQVQTGRVIPLQDRAAITASGRLQSIDDQRAIVGSDHL